MIEAYNWSVRTLWAIAGITACFLFYEFYTDYAACRADGSHVVGCFVWALFLGFLKCILLALIGCYKFLVLILP